jgi:hypothetical protein
MELLLHTSTESIGTISLGPNVNKGHPRINAPIKWTQITATSKKVNRQEHNKIRSQDKVIDTSNRYAHLTKFIDNGDMIPIIVNGASLSEKNYKPQPSAKGKLHTNKARNNVFSECPKRRNKIVIIGDSHSRDIADEVQPRVGKDFTVQALVKPGASIEAILHQTDSELASLTKKDVCIIWGGTHDIAKMESNLGLQHLIKFISKHKNTKVIFVEVPPRYDLKRDSCVNEETREFSRKLKNLSEQFANLCVIETSIDREMYTRHGLHINRRGKEQASIKISTEIGNILKRNKMNPEVQKEKQVSKKDKAIVGAVKVKVGSVSDTEIASADLLGITTSTPNKHEEIGRAHV